jgi:hypothetical protein
MVHASACPSTRPRNAVDDEADNTAMTSWRYLMLGILIAGAVSGGCGDSNPIGPSNQPEVANTRDNFQFQASSLRGTTQTLNYTWENTGTAANVNQSGQISSGTARLTLRDASGTEVYNRALTETGTFATAAGATGNWRIEVRLENVTGTINFRVQKP